MNLLTSQNGALNEIITPGMREGYAIDQKKKRKKVAYISSISLPYAYFQKLVLKFS